MPEDLMCEFGVTSEHAYYKELRCLLSMSLIIDMTAKALLEAPKRSEFIDHALVTALGDYVITLQTLSSDINKINQ